MRCMQKENTKNVREVYRERFPEEQAQATFLCGTCAASNSTIVLVYNNLRQIEREAA